MTTVPANSESVMATLPALVRIPAAEFLMGSDSGQDCERPVHRVWVDSFNLAATQVTSAEYELFLRATGAPPPPFRHDPNFNHPQQAVAGVSWHEAARYCEWLSAQTTRLFRLPTEAEWELAARGGLDQKQFPWGDAPPQSLPDYAKRWQNARNPLPATPRMASASTTSATTSMSGAATGTIRTIIRSRRNATRKALSIAR